MTAQPQSAKVERGEAVAYIDALMRANPNANGWRDRVAQYMENERRRESSVLSVAFDFITWWTRFLVVVVIFGFIGILAQYVPLLTSQFWTVAFIILGVAAALLLASCLGDVEWSEMTENERWWRKLPEPMTRVMHDIGARFKPGVVFRISGLGDVLVLWVKPWAAPVDDFYPILITKKGQPINPPPVAKSVPWWKRDIPHDDVTTAVS